MDGNDVASIRARCVTGNAIWMIDFPRTNMGSDSWELLISSLSPVKRHVPVSEVTAGRLFV